MPPQAKARAGSAPAMYQPMMMSARHQPMMMMPANAIGMGLPGAVGGGAGPRAGTRVVQGTHAFNWGYPMPAGAYLQPQSAMFHIPSSRSAQPMSPVPVIQTGSGIRASYIAQPIMLSWHGNTTLVRTPTLGTIGLSATPNYCSRLLWSTGIACLLHLVDFVQ